MNINLNHHHHHHCKHKATASARTATQHKLFVISSQTHLPIKTQTTRKHLFQVQHSPSMQFNNSLSKSKKTTLFHYTKPTNNIPINIINTPPSKPYSHFFKRRIKYKFSISKPNPLLEKKMKRIREIKTKSRKTILSSSSNVASNTKEHNYEIGRWKLDEHKRFVEAIIKYGNDWKQVQKCVRTRSSTQARSHAQKFFIKIKKAKLLPFELDLTRNSIKMLHELVMSKKGEEYEKMLQDLIDVAFDRKSCHNRRRKSQSKSTMLNSDTNNEMIVDDNNEQPTELYMEHNDHYYALSYYGKRSRKTSVEMFVQQERKMSRRRMSSIDVDNEINEDNNDKKSSYDANHMWNMMENGNNCNNINDDITRTFFKGANSRKVSAEDDFLFNYIKH
jgi:SHAQKYF class myb-like DNA-binding protein